MILGEFLRKHRGMLKRHPVARRAAQADRVRPDVGPGLLFFEFLEVFAVHSVGAFVVDDHLESVADSRLLDRIEGLRASLAEHEHELVAVRVRVAAHEGRVLLAVDHQVVHVEPDFLKVETLSETGEAASAVDAVADDPHHDAALRRDAEESVGDGFKVEVVALVVAQGVVGRRSDRQVDALRGHGLHEVDAVCRVQSVESGASFHLCCVPVVCGCFTSICCVKQGDVSYLSVFSVDISGFIRGLALRRAESLARGSACVSSPAPRFAPPKSPF